MLFGVDFNNNATEGVRDDVKVLCGYGVTNVEGQMEKECSGHKGGGKCTQVDLCRKYNLKETGNCKVQSVDLIIDHLCNQHITRTNFKTTQSGKRNVLPVNVLRTTFCH